MENHLIIATAVIAAAAVTTTHASVIVQAPGQDYIAFEAESFTTASSNFQLVTESTTPDIPADFSGGAGMWVAGDVAGVPFIGAKTAGTNVMTYTLVFNQTGTYSLFNSGLVGTDTAETDISEGAEFSGNDSVFFLNTVGADPSAAGSYSQAVPGPTGAGVATQGFATSSGVNFNITAADLGVPVTFAVSEREDGNVLDRFVFSLDSSFGSFPNSGDFDGEFDGLANSPVVPIPEPTSAAVGLLGCRPAGRPASSCMIARSLLPTRGRVAPQRATRLSLVVADVPTCTPTPIPAVAERWPTPANPLTSRNLRLPGST